MGRGNDENSRQCLLCSDSFADRTIHKRICLLYAILMSHHRLGQTSDSDESENDDATGLPPSMHESLRGGDTSSDNDDEDNYEPAETGMDSLSLPRETGANSVNNLSERAHLLGACRSDDDGERRSNRYDESSSISLATVAGQSNRRSSTTAGDGIAYLQVELDNSKSRKKRRSSASRRHAVQPKERVSHTCKSPLSLIGTRKAGVA